MIPYLWLIFMPLLFMPNLGGGRPTPFGVLEISDALILPYLVLVYFGARIRRRLLVDDVFPVLGLFFAWAFLSSVTISVRYDYGYSTRPMLFSLFKLGKFGLYALAGFWTVRATAAPTARRWFHWSALVSALIVGVSLYFSRDSANLTGPPEIGYKANNGVSVMMAMFLCYIVGEWMGRRDLPIWRRWVTPSLIILSAGFLVSDGRGGWLAAFIGLSYLFAVTGFRKQVIVAVPLVIALIAVGYTVLPDFRDQVDKTLHPNESEMEMYNYGVAGYDDGGRTAIWIHESSKFVDAPFLGTGFFHRGGLVRIARNGSHNFFLQMFLETGLVGGILFLVAVSKMWRHTASTSLPHGATGISSRAAILAGCFGAMGGEYFYGGMILFTLFVVYSWVGAVPAPERRRKSMPLIHSMKGVEST